MSPSTSSATAPGGHGSWWNTSLIERPTMARTSVSRSTPSRVGNVRICRPSRRTVTALHTPNTSSRRCETYKMTRPSSRRRRMTSKRRSASRLLRLLVGSSNAMTLALRDRALAISTICRWPIESDPTVACGSIASPKAVSRARASS